MANTLTSLIPDVYSALDVVSRELVGAIPTFTRDSTADRAAMNQTVRSFATRAAVATTITPGVTPPDDGDQTVDNVSLTITKAQRVPIRWNGEQALGVNNAGPGQSRIFQDQVQQALRTLVNQMEADCFNAARIAASRGYGTAGTTPFASDLSASANIRKILDDNGAPPSDRALLINTTAGAQMRTLTQLTKANEAGTDMTLRSGELITLHGFSVHESAAVIATTKGTGTSYTSTTAGFPVGTTSIPLITGNGTVLAGDIVTFTGDTTQYVVTVGVAAPGTITIGSPGLVKPLAASAVAMTIGNTFTPNIAYPRSAMVLATRLPALPPNGDIAIDRTTITDPRSGISFELAMYPQYRQMQYEISAAWGATGVKSAHAAILLG